MADKDNKNLNTEPSKAPKKHRLIKDLQVQTVAHIEKTADETVKNGNIEVDGDNFTNNLNVLVSVNNVSMRFKLPSERVDNFKEAFIKKISGKLKYKEFWVLKDINLTLRRGESLAIIGRNGAGKSTLLSLISGIYYPTKGNIQVRGKIVPLLRLGAGFDLNATGKENVFLNGAILGFNKKLLEEKYNEIVEFSELKDFMNVPIKNYSSGMLARLGFAIAVSVHPDIMIVDEILSVGDAPFQKKCADKIAELQKAGTTFLLVSHNMARVKALCQRAIWIKDGGVVMQGTANEVADAYSKEYSK